MHTAVQCKIPINPYSKFSVFRNDASATVSKFCVLVNFDLCLFQIFNSANIKF